MLLVNRSFHYLSFSLSLFWNECLSGCLSIMHLVSFFSSHRHFPNPSLSWCSVEKRCVFVCASHPLDCAGKQCEWERSMRRTGSICTVKDSPGSLRSHVPLLFSCGEREWLRSRGFSRPADVQFTKGGRDGLRNRLWWSNQNDKFDSLDEGPQFVEQIAERWRDWTLCGLIL